jgi:starvation-inducible DNA-binding protein
MARNAPVKTRQFATRIDIPAGSRAALIELLNQSLAETFDLYSQVKQAHWNVKGEEFFQLHELFDTIAAELLAFVDLIAERAVILGGTAQGTVRMAAEHSSLPEYPADVLDGLEHVEALADRLGPYAAHVRGGIDRADELGDKTTADLYTEVSRKVDMRLWFLEAHLQGRE